MPASASHCTATCNVITDINDQLQAITLHTGTLAGHRCNADRQALTWESLPLLHNTTSDRSAQSFAQALPSPLVRRFTSASLPPNCSKGMFTDPAARQRISLGDNVQREGTLQCSPSCSTAFGLMSQEIVPDGPAPQLRAPGRWHMSNWSAGRTSSSSGWLAGPALPAAVAPDSDSAAASCSADTRWLGDSSCWQGAASSAACRILANRLVVQHKEL